ncbi:hypothetical protein AVEN_133310-1 [Araneus ventricosus]|uniref:Uncharacterized protein n=1 Tax=Araneus ventricosus TaxID=182803 RepID=A0A4Y2DJT6_ARAVE|nr:hypothetical protein AVEN_133310-1 [Araneus ventricosus]
MAIAQDSDVELRSLLGSSSGLELNQLSLPSSEHLLYCDISTGSLRRSRCVTSWLKQSPRRSMRVGSHEFEFLKLLLLTEEPISNRILSRPYLNL